MGLIQRIRNKAKISGKKAAFLGQLLTPWRKLRVCNVLLVEVLERSIGSCMRFRRQICLPRIMAPNSHCWW